MPQRQLGYLVLEILSNPKEFQTMKKKHDKADKVGNKTGFKRERQKREESEKQKQKQILAYAHARKAKRCLINPVSRKMCP